jgi:type IV pilus assembly protein PilA
MKLIETLNSKIARKQKKAGFSLVELLVVIAVIGILAAIAIPALSNIFDSADNAKARRNAQNLASTYGAARAAGATVAELGGSGTDADATGATILAAVAKLKDGVAGKGSFSNTKFTLSDLSSDECGDAAAYLTWKGGELVYKSADQNAVTN